jgi:PAS domain S-box-containing protein
MDSAAIFRLMGRSIETEGMAGKNRELFESELRIQENNITEPGEDQATRKLRAGWMDYKARHDRLAAMTNKGEAEQFYFATLYPSFLLVKNSADDVLTINQDAMARKSDRVRLIADRMNTFMIFSTVGAALLGLFLSFTLTSRMLRPLSVLSQAVRRIGEGDLEARARVQGQDEIAHLAAEFNTMATQMIQYRRSSLGELFQAQQTTQAAIDSLPDPVVVFDIEGNVINVNQAAERLLGLVLSPQVRDPLGSIEPALRDILEQVKKHVLSGKGAYNPKGFDEAVRVPSSEGDRYFLARANPLYGEEEGVLGVTVILQEVTRLRRFDELKNDLVATVAHEFRTPLTSLRMAIHLCLDETAGQLTDKQSDLLYAAREDCERLQSMLDDLLDLSRIQSGRVEMKRRPTSTVSLIDSAIALHRLAAEGQGVRLKADLEGIPDAEVLADPERIHLVLTNLITNAIRHTAAGGQIEVRARAQGEEIRFEVTDTGEGIATEYQSRVFDKFFRVPGAGTTGVGLGLSICREIVEAHGGEIGVESNPGQGSTFWFTLPLAASAV